MQALKKQRGVIKGYFTRFNNFLLNASVTNPSAVAEVKVRFSKFNSLWDEFKNIQGQIENLNDDEVESKYRDEFESLFFSSSAEAELFIQNSQQNAEIDTSSLSSTQTASTDALFNDIKRFETFINNGYNQSLPELQLRTEEMQAVWDRYKSSLGGSNTNANLEDSYFKVVANAKSIMLNATSQGTYLNRNTTNSPMSSIKLPEINLPNFSGSYTDWLHFHDTFHSIIHSNKTLSDAQKFHYLRASLKKEAANIIQALEVSDQNYNIAWDLLKQRFQNKRLIIHSHIKNLFELTAITKESHSVLRELVDTIQKHLRALKALGQPTDSWDTPMVYLINTKLDNATRHEWEKSNTTDTPSLDQLLKFLENRCILLETLDSNNISMSNNSSVRATSSRFPHRITAHVATDKTNVCKICNQQHLIFRCDQFLKLDVQARIDEVKRLHLCLNCLRPGHLSYECKFGSCKYCYRKHNSLLHLLPQQPQQVSNAASMQAHNDQVTQESASVNCLANKLTESSEVLLSTALVLIEDNVGKLHQCRALVDVGSQSNFITETFFNKLSHQPIHINIPVYGINERISIINKSVSVTIKSMHNHFQTSLNCLVLSKITENLPLRQFPLSSVQAIPNIKLADPHFNISSPIELLLGADVFWQILKSNQIKATKNSPHYQETTLDWLVGGRAISILNKEPKSTMCNVNMSAIENNLVKFWEIEGYDIKPENLSEEERCCEEFYKKTQTRDQQGRFIVRLPFKNSIPTLGSSFEIAERRLKSLERRFNRDEELKRDYTEFINEYIKLGHMEPVLANDKTLTENTYYLPHHAVFKDSTTTRLRVVFDASAKSTNGISLNDQLMVGPKIQQDLFSIILRFRIYQYVITADIAKMYRQILVAKEDRDYQRILWSNNALNQIQIYRLKTVTYGTSSAPYLAVRSLQQLALEEGDKFPLAKFRILNDFYVDDLITGSNTVDQAISIREQVTNCLKLGGFELHKWASNDPRILSIPESEINNQSIKLNKQSDTKTLGLHWNYSTDTLRYVIAEISQEKKVTKRIILSTVSKLFDPLGLIQPVLVSPKVIMQRLWSSKIDWDTTVPANICHAWLEFTAKLHTLHKLKIPRKVVSNLEYIYIELHGFCDASEIAYGACIYIRTLDRQGNHTTQLLCAKSRIAPLKTLTIPKLELCSAVLLARLAHKTIQSLNIPINRTFFWTDSTIVLAWLSVCPSTWKIFVAHRVSEIQSLSNSRDWYHINTQQNPADIISRGIMPDGLINSKLWWHGPTFLYHNDSEWPSQGQESSNHDYPEKRNVTLVATVNSDFLNVMQRYSSFSRLQRIVAYCLRFIKNCKIKVDRLKGTLSCLELHSATIQIIKLVQEVDFSEELHLLSQNNPIKRTSRLISLNPFIDTQGILRVGGRLENSSFNFDKKHPILLPAKHYVTKLLVLREHQRQLHAGQQATLAALRQHFWPISGRNIVRQIIRSCIKCFRVKPKQCNQLMGNLPITRVEPARPFINSGVDYAGPILIKDGRGRGKRQVKAYIALFICFSTKAIHLELVGDLTMESFIAALKRFMARRGKVSNLYSDNGTNFVAANRELQILANLFRKTEFQEKVIVPLAQDNITWNFIPPRSPSFGGLWEANIKSVKNHIKKILGNASVNYEEMYTLLVQIEACLNSRPLIPLSNDPNDLSALTPGHFLVGSPLTSTLEPDITTVPMNRISRWKRIEQLRQHFWRRWSREFVPWLTQRTKWRSKTNDNLEPGTLVVIHDDKAPPLRWQLGRICEGHPGKDGITRVVSIKTNTGITKRAIGKICVLPTRDPD